jgi:hypothetical protein
VLRSTLVAIAPPLFGYLSAHWTTNPAVHAIGLQRIFLVMLLPVLAPAFILIAFARRTYLRDVATAPQHTHDPGDGGWTVPDLVDTRS